MNKAVCALFSDTAVTAIYCRNTWFLLRPSHLLLWVSFFWFSSVLLGKCRGSTAMKPGLLPYSPSVFIQLHRHCAVWISHSTTGCTQQQMHCVFIGRMHTAADALYIPWQDSYSNRCTVYSLAGCTQQRFCAWSRLNNQHYYNINLYFCQWNSPPPPLCIWSFDWTNTFTELPICCARCHHPSPWYRQTQAQSVPSFVRVCVPHCTKLCDLVHRERL